MSASAAPSSTQRIDQWLWRARIFKTRTLASKFVSDGNVRLTRAGRTQRVEKPSTAIAPGDVIAFSRFETLRILEIAALAARRGPASEAEALYRDQSPPPPPREAKPTPAFRREPGAGRPTKKDRRALDALKT